MAADSEGAMDETGGARRPPINCNLLRSWRDPPEGDVLIHFPYREPHPPPPEQLLPGCTAKKVCSAIPVVRFSDASPFRDPSAFWDPFLSEGEKQKTLLMKTNAPQEASVNWPRRTSESERLSGTTCGTSLIGGQWQRWRRLTWEVKSPDPAGVRLSFFK